MIAVRPFCIVGRMSKALKPVHLLSSTGHLLTMPIEHWRDALVLATDHGWRPQGREQMETVGWGFRRVLESGGTVGWIGDRGGVGG